MSCVADYIIKSFIRMKREPKKSQANSQTIEQSQLVQDLTSSWQGMIRPLLFLSAQELEMATNNYDKRQILGWGSAATVYKGTYQDRPIAVKKYNRGSWMESKCFVREAVLLTIINHKNVAKLLACCFETDEPVLVYECIPHGTLLNYINEKEKLSEISLEDRLQIATEIADAITYLHLGNPRPIVHGRISRANILLDQNLSPRIINFEWSIMIPSGKTHVTELVRGTKGYIAPEYEMEGLLTEKSDVYSFGVLMLELLSGKKVHELGVDISTSRLNVNFLNDFISAMTKDFLGVLTDPGVQENKQKQLSAFGNLIMKCTQVNDEDRPTMKEVAQNLREIRSACISSEGTLDKRASYPMKK
ncbi:hypothetical protein H6P81_001100 [Aristolochia fimbriata]|uniref:Protein kinase domain-containing protein n=1 Tax=Aristolochia fimbriata TaxID=158543 RepID=A0AAV7F623_ARIFI|nr:hypothetical protein H6P81_001100 [Aristolochia fimbriata]